MHAASFAALGIPAVYGAVRCDATALPTLMRALASSGGGNVTIPHKQIALAALDQSTPTALAVGAANTFWGDDGLLIGDNTDVEGIKAAVAELTVPSGGWLIIGTGGSARAAVIAAIALDVSVCIRSRDPRRGREFTRWAEAAGARAASTDECALCINTTPLGLRADDPLPLHRAAAPHAVAALDMVYVAGTTAWVRHWRRHGCAAADGRSMLVAQGAASARRWFPDIEPSVAAMRRAVDAALG